MPIGKKTRNQKSYIIEELHSYDLLLDSREIFIHGYVGDIEEDPGVDYRMATTFVKNMVLLENFNHEPITIHQHSVGGDWQLGMMMFDAINNAKSHIIFIMHGDACSMGSIIPQAADTRVMMPHCCFMVHDGRTGIESGLTIKQSKSWARWEEQTSDIMMEIYAHVCINGEHFNDEDSNVSTVKAFIRRRMDADEDWFLTANEAVKYGFADAVLGSKGYETVQDIKNRILSDY